MTTQQATSVVCTFATLVGTLFVHYLTPAQVAETGTVIGVVIAGLIGVRAALIPGSPTPAGVRRALFRRLLLLPVLVLVVGCAAAQDVAQGVVTLAGDACKLIAQDDPTAPQWVTVACAVEGLTGPVVVNLPWSAWTSAQGQQIAAAKARLAAAKAAKP